MMKRTKLILLFLTISIKLFADCDEKSFKQTYLDIYKKDNTLIFVKGIKIEDYYHGIKLKILENFSKNDIKDTITVWYCNRDQILECNFWDNQSKYKTNDTLICILGHTNLMGNIIRCDTCPDRTDTIDIEKKDDYQIITCYPSVLQLSHGMVSGRLLETKKDTTVLYSDFEKMLSEPLGISYSKVIGKQIIIFPNPTDDMLNIEFADNVFLKSVSIIDVFGRLIDKKEVKMKNNRYLYSMKEYISGSYFVRLEFSDKIVIREIYKQ